MNRPKVRGYYEAPTSRYHISVQIADPWHPKDYFLFRMPEILLINDSRYLYQPRGVNCWPTVQPEAEPEWSIDDDERAASYQIRFYDGIELSVSALATDCDIQFSYVIKNETGATVRASIASCFMTWNAPHFIDRRHERTFVWVDKVPLALRDLTPTPEDLRKMPWVKVGVGCPLEMQVEQEWWTVREAADHGLVCVRSREGKCALGLAWADAGAIFARSAIPCIHSEPDFPTVQPGQSVEATGKLYFSDEGISSIAHRFSNDIADNTLSVVVKT